jgi:hypothetical protein
MSEEKHETPNARLLALVRQHVGRPDYHPILTLADIASNSSSDDNVRVNAAKGMLPFLEPQMKAIEIRGNLKHDFGVLKVSLMDDDDNDDVLDSDSVLEIGED